MNSFRDFISIFCSLILFASFFLAGCGAMAVRSPGTSGMGTAYYSLSADGVEEDKGESLSPSSPCVLYSEGIQKMTYHDWPGRMYGRIYGIRGTYPLSNSGWGLDLGLLRLSTDHEPTSLPMFGTYGHGIFYGTIIPVAIRYEIQANAWLRPFVRAGISYNIFFAHEDFITGNSSSFAYDATMNALGVEAGTGLRFLYKNVVFEVGIDYGICKGSMEIEHDYFAYPEIKYYIQENMENIDLGPKPRVYIAIGLRF